MKLLFVCSGSKGNATFISSNNTLIQIDMGAPITLYKKALGTLNKSVNDINACFITHNHADHIKSLSFFKDNVPIYGGSETLEKINAVSDGVGVDIGDFTIIPFSSSHDAPTSFNYLIINKEGERLCYVTDSGYLPAGQLDLIKDCTYYYFESNYDKDMLMNSSRPRYLKNRIKGRHGHMDNKQCASYLSKLIGPSTKQVYLGHLSLECNDYDLALNYVSNYLQDKIGFSKDKVFLTKQFESVLGGEQ